MLFGIDFITGKTTFDYVGNYIFEVHEEFRAKNGFGGYNVDEITAEVDTGGNVLDAHFQNQP